MKMLNPLLLWCLLQSFVSLAVDPLCDTSWSKTTAVWTCSGNGKISFVANSSFLPAQNLTLVASNGFSLQNNVVGSLNIRVNLQADYGAIVVSGSSSELYGNIVASSSHLTLTQLRSIGTISTGGDISLVGGRVIGNITSNSNKINIDGTEVSGAVWSHSPVTLKDARINGAITSNSGTITSSNSQLTGDLTAQSGISLSGGTMAGHLLQKAKNPITLTNVSMSSGSIKGASTVNLSGSTLGNSNNKVEVKSESGDISLSDNSVLYGDAIAVEGQTWGKVNISSGSKVYGRCHFQAVPPEACQAEPPAPTVHHYELSFQSPALTCEAETVSLRACVDQACSSLYQGEASVSLSASNNASWATGTLYFSYGQASNALRKTSAGSTVLGIAAASPAATSALVCKNGGQISNCSLDFAATALKITATDGRSAWPHQVAGTDYTGRVKAIQTNPETGACQARVKGIRQVGLAFRCLNPGSCIATERGNFFSVAVAGSGNSPAYTNVNLTFDNNGVAPLRFRYSDVGQIALYAQLQLSALGNDPAITLTATPATLVVKPDRLVVASVSAAGQSNLGTTNSGAGFTAAGSLFQVELEARNSLDLPTPNFGRESQPEKMQLAFAGLVYPSAQPNVNYAEHLLVNGDFVAVPAKGGRVVNAQVAFREAGTIKLQAKLADGNYLAAGDVSASPASGNVGRFYPAAFQLDEVQSSPLCSDGQFSYMQQPNLPLKFSLYAMSQAINQPGLQVPARQLLNYHQFAGGATSYAGLAVPELVAENVTPQQWQQLSSRLVSQPALQWQQGKLSFDGRSGLVFSRNTMPDGPFLAVQAGVRIGSEQDNRQLVSTVLTMNAANNADCSATAACDAAPLGAPLAFYHGRLTLQPAQGPQNQQLPLRLQAQVWDGSRFSNFAADSCSQIDPAALSVLAMPDWKAAGNSQSLLQGSTATHSLWLLPQAQSGRWTMQYALPAWLKQRDGEDDTDAKASVVIGGYRGNDRLIYQREQ
jgi:MSHA biogenesis protein MshQ